MFLRCEVGLYFFLKAGKPLWTIILSYTAVNTIGMVFIYFTTDLVKSKTEGHFSKFSKLKPIKKIKDFLALKLSKPFKTEKLKKGIIDWLSKRKLIFIFLIYLLPLPLPYIPSIIIVLVRLRNIKYGFWSLFLGSIVKQILFVYLVWIGFINIK
jgi:hypothetical protein